MSSTSHDKDIESQAGAHDTSCSCKAKPNSTPTSLKDLKDRAGQACFLCLECPKQGSYAVSVPCIKPSTVREVASYRIDRASGQRTYTYKSISWREIAHESDSEIWRRLVTTCYQYQGKWKKWLPYYGVTEVEEVSVSEKCIRAKPG